MLITVRENGRISKMPGNSNFIPNEKSQLFNWLLAISDKNFLLKLLKFWRVGGDSNPRNVSVYTLSKRAPSATRPPILFYLVLNFQTA